MLTPEEIKAARFYAAEKTNEVKPVGIHAWNEMRDGFFARAIEATVINKMEAATRDAESELNCAEEILDALAVDLNLQKTDFECIGDYITAVVGKMKDDARMWQAVRRNWKTYKASYINDFEDAPNVMKSATITLGFYEGHPEKSAQFIERDLRESIEYFENVPRVNGVVVTHWMDDRGYVITDNWLRYSKNSTSDYREAYNIPCVKVKGKVVRLK